jgi:hypothetical protein
LFGPRRRLCDNAVVASLRSLVHVDRYARYLDDGGLSDGNERSSGVDGVHCR